MGHVLEGGQQTALNAGNDTAVDRWPPFLPQGLVHDWLQKGVYAGRRQRLLAQLAPDSVALLPTLPEQVRSRDTHHRYRADSSVVYLTGFAEPDVVLVLQPGTAQPFGLFCRPRDPEREIWDGRRAGVEGALARYQADQAWPVDTLDEQVLTLLAGKKHLYTRLGQDPDWDARVSRWLGQLNARQRQGVSAPVAVVQLEPLIEEMRLIKDAHEIALMQQAADLSAAAHVRAMQRVRPGQMEYALQAELEYVFAQGGGVPAYGSIVGGGANACILHYIDNDQPLQAGDLVLIDAGAELGHYAADITRTFPVSGRFSAEQKALYELVLDAQLEAIRWVQVGQHCKVYHEKAVEVLTAGLVRLGLLSGEVSALIESGAYRRFYMHGTGHWLGMDVHDAGAYKVDGQWRPLQAGMVVTVEPGLYVAADDDTVAPRWRGIGIRIEDDVLVTEQGPRVLTAGVPKQVGALEALIQGIPSLGD